METGESIKDTVVREFREETGLYLNHPILRGVFTFIIKDGGKIVDEWMMFTFYAESFEGQWYEESQEGKIAWHPFDRIKDLPMAEGDRHVLEYLLHGHGMIYGTFDYTPDFELLSYRLDPS